MASSIVQTSRFAIVGLGLLGGSLAKRMRAIHARSVFGIARRAEVLQKACDDGLIEAGSDDPSEILPVVDLTFICLPLTATIDFVEANLDNFRSGSIVTDVGSVKGSIVSGVREMLLERGVYFIGSHPMAGSEKSGIEFSQADLYQDKIVFLTPTAEDNPDAIHLLREIWRELGAQPIELDSDRHDAAVAFSSHVPHLLAGAAVQAVLGEGDPEAQAIACAGGFRDFSRIAASNPSMWSEICAHNRDSVLASLDSFEARLAAIRSCVETSDWDALQAELSRAADLRAAWNETHGERLS
ncbi:MAG: prephenate dehydrogenase [Rhodothermales bacterium]|jgi:prephenate dehydrogenase